MSRTLGSIAGAAVWLAWAGPALAAPPPNGGTVAIQPHLAPEDDASGPAFAAAAREALSAHGFTMLDDPDHAAYVADLLVSRADAGTGSAKVRTGGPSVTAGGMAGAGAGVSVPLGTGRSALVTLVRTRLEVRLHKRGDPVTVWNGAAVTVRPAGTDKGSDEVVAADLARVILAAYPIQPEGEVGVP